MRIFSDAVYINISPSQKRLLCDPANAEYVRGPLTMGDGRRPRIPISEIDGLVAKLRELRDIIEANPDYSRRRPRQVIDQVILKLKIAQTAQLRTYPTGFFRTKW